MANDDLKNLWHALELVADGGSGKEALQYSKQYVAHNCTISVDESKNNPVLLPSWMRTSSAFVS